MGITATTLKRKNKKSLEKALLKIMDLPNDTLMEMGKRSVQLALQQTPEIWASTLMSIIDNQK